MTPGHVRQILDCVAFSAKRIGAFAGTIDAERRNANCKHLIEQLGGQKFAELALLADFCDLLSTFAGEQAMAEYAAPFCAEVQTTFFRHFVAYRVPSDESQTRGHIFLRLWSLLAIPFGALCPETSDLSTDLVSGYEAMTRDISVTDRIYECRESIMTEAGEAVAAVDRTFLRKMLDLNEQMRIAIHSEARDGA